jgi:hypothetical protein
VPREQSPSSTCDCAWAHTASLRSITTDRWQALSGRGGSDGTPLSSDTNTMRMQLWHLLSLPLRRSSSSARTAIMLGTAPYLGLLVCTGCWLKRFLRPDFRHSGSTRGDRSPRVVALPTMVAMEAIAIVTSPASRSLKLAER